MFCDMIMTMTMMKMLTITFGDDDVADDGDDDDDSLQRMTHIWDGFEILENCNFN